MAIAILGGYGIDAASMSAAAIFVGGAVLFFMRANNRSVHHTTDELIVENDGEIVRVPKAGTTVELREVEQYGFRGHRQYVNFVDESTRPAFDNTKTAKRYLFLVPAEGRAVRVEAGIGRSPKALRELHHDLEVAIASR
ncbi:MAG: hypothetical protein AAGE98_11565 [Actinomycetota bacterium]